jgi:hypothetical protein
MFQRWWSLSARGSCTTLSGPCGASLHARFPCASVRNDKCHDEHRPTMQADCDDAWANRPAGRIFGASLIPWLREERAFIAPSKMQQPVGRAKGEAEEAEEAAWKAQTPLTNLAPRPPRSGAHRRRRIHGMFHELISHRFPSSSYPPLHRPSCPGNALER